MNARRLRLLFNLYPPFLGAGIRVTEITPDFARLRVEMPLRWYNRNYVGTHFGGSLASMTDPFFMLLLMHRLGREYIVWDMETRIRFVAPGKGRVHAVFEVDDERVAEARAATADGRKHTPTWPVTIRAEDGSVVAEVDKTLYVRRKRP